MEKEKVDGNCKTCLYANFLKNGDVVCDIKLLSKGIKIHINADKTDLSCPTHSSNGIKETRYGYTNTYRHESEDKDCCSICHREVDLSKPEQYSYIPVKDEEGNIIDKKLVCCICKDKGRI